MKRETMHGDAPCPCCEAVRLIGPPDTREASPKGRSYARLPAVVFTLLTSVALVTPSTTMYSEDPVIGSAAFVLSLVLATVAALAIWRAVLRSRVEDLEYLVKSQDEWVAHLLRTDPRLKGGYDGR